MNLRARARARSLGKIQPALWSSPLDIERLLASRPSSSPTPGYQCDPAALLAYLDRLLAERSSRDTVDLQTPTGHLAGGLAVFFVELRRSDRTAALAGLEAARAVTDDVCSRIGDILRPGDRFALNGVDELVMVLPEVDSSGRAMLVASRLVGSLQQPLRAASQQTRVRPAIGCALYPAHGDDAEALIAAADRASRAARSAEEGYRVGVRSEHAVGTDSLATAFEVALRGNELQVWLQPQFDLKSGRFDAAEALIRWPRSDGQAPVSPIATVELAEEHGLIPELTVFVLNTVLRQSAEFAQRGIAMRIAVNVSASLLTDRNLPLTVKHALELWDVPPDRLTLEVTENTLMQDVETSLVILHDLKRLGTHLSLDDFGTGYSSFAYLRRMPLDELKIDQLFVRNLNGLADGTGSAEGEDDLRIVRSIIDIAHNFDLRTVAEGVENAATLELLRGLGCDVIQGYHTGRPMPIASIEDWWRSRQP